MNNTKPSPSHNAIVCPPCNGNGGLLQSCIPSDGYGEPSCNPGLKCRNYMGRSNICVPSGLGTNGNRCVPGYGDLMTCYDGSRCHRGMCTRGNNVVTVRNMNGWVIGAIVSIIILLIILLIIGLVGGNGNGKSKSKSKSAK